MKRILYILLMLIASHTLHAQTAPTQSGAERVQALRVAFLTQRLALTPAEAQVFWPVYNEYQDKRDALRKQAAENRRKIREQAEQLSSEELTRLADEEIRFREEDVKLQAELHAKLKTILPAKKLALLYVAEEEFKKELVKQVTEDNSGKPKQGQN
ncbi:MAG: hypothetical protein MUC87_16725 [Bacteroidia bacterium]|jgi:hypothetical protein|nr:hypothetical protein [Bacteroidia bacterium]